MHHTSHLSFQNLKEKAAQAVDIQGHDLNLPVTLYTDASKYAAGCVIFQKQSGVDVPILFDSFLFTQPQRNYGVYKRGLLAIVEFCRKYDYKDLVMVKNFDLGKFITDNKLDGAGVKRLLLADKQPEDIRAYDFPDGTLYAFKDLCTKNMILQDEMIAENKKLPGAGMMTPFETQMVQVSAGILRQVPRTTGKHY